MIQNLCDKILLIISLNFLKINKSNIIYLCQLTKFFFNNSTIKFLLIYLINLILSSFNLNLIIGRCI